MGALPTQWKHICSHPVNLAHAAQLSASRGTYHQMNPEHLHRYVAEFAGRHNDRPRDTVDQMRLPIVQQCATELRNR